MTGDGAAGRPVSHRSGPRPRAAVLLSVLASAATVAAVGCFCALVYPIIKELRAERVRGEDGTEQRMLGFWSILVLSVLVGCICCVFSWTFSYLDSYQPGMVFSMPQTLAHFRDGSGRGFLMSYGVAVLNGVMAMLTVIWSLS
ncbi:ADP-ribosylation factor-like protein 6-interacting protein 6 [Amphiprion ocellaris]|uniref:ADP-ribosylation factor-like protein 6-interacting protein 6 n=1 Tax=Amphiprion ocellaris TaxID=80972 RepID=UPI000C3194CD|nr:ADP-ribosylation factor-like protein 6-interacting protein 6 [Amphiprion ocellaris]